jgi:hypothetical protein
MVRKITTKEEFFAAMERERERKERREMAGLCPIAEKKVERKRRTAKRG